jgi:hypothetical protein
MRLHMRRKARGNDHHMETFRLSLLHALRVLVLRTVQKYALAPMEKVAFKLVNNWYMIPLEDLCPLFRFHRWRANLRVLEIKEIKSVPCVPCSHPFVERLIGTVRREYLDHSLFWNRLDLQRKLDGFAAYYNESRVHSRLAGTTPSEHRGRPSPRVADLQQFSWQVHCHGLFHTPIAA